MATYGEALKNVRYYLGVWNADGRNIVIHQADLESYADAVTYNGYFVVVSCEEIEWGVQG